MNVKEVKKPIGFASWSEGEEKDQEKGNGDIESYDDKFCEYDNMLTGLIEEATKNRNLFLKEKRKRMLLEMQAIDLQDEIKKLNKKIKKLKKAKD